MRPSNIHLPPLTFSPGIVRHRAREADCPEREAGSGLRHRSRGWRRPPPDTPAGGFRGQLTPWPLNDKALTSRQQSTMSPQTKPGTGQTLRELRVPLPGELPSRTVPRKGNGQGAPRFWHKMSGTVQRKQPSGRTSSRNGTATSVLTWKSQPNWQLSSRSPPEVQPTGELVIRREGEEGARHRATDLLRPAH